MTQPLNRPARVLLVEDEDNIAIAIDVVLTREGFEVHRVATGSQALPNARAQNPDVVVLDVTLPEVSGYEICQQMRADPAFAQTPIVMTSARASQAEQRKGLALGATVFLAKPFATADLIAQVHRLSPPAQTSQNQPQGATS